MTIQEKRDQLRAHLAELKKWFNSRRPDFLETCTEQELQQWIDRATDERGTLAALAAIEPL